MIYRLMSPHPVDMTIEGFCYVFDHKKLGELGRIVMIKRLVNKKCDAG